MWKSPREDSSGWSADPLHAHEQCAPGGSRAHTFEHASPGGTHRKSSSRLHEHVQMTPGGSRAHSFEHTSPGGSVRFEAYTSPADVRATREQKIGWRSRIGYARMVARVRARARICYTARCVHCRRADKIAPDGCMRPHSIQPTLTARERVAYRESEAFAEHGWECPGSRKYFGPREDESVSEAESEDESRSEEEEGCSGHIW